MHIQTFMYHICNALKLKKTQYSLSLYFAHSIVDNQMQVDSQALQAFDLMIVMNWTKSDKQEMGLTKPDNVTDNPKLLILVF